jgi:prepilin-type N-terminal cleavage/methylation domain-containing protein
MVQGKRIEERGQGGFTLTEVLVAIVVLMVCLVAIAQLIPASIVSNATNRNDSSAMVLAQSELNQMIAQPLTSTGFTDALSNACVLGDPTQPGQAVGSVLVTGQPVIDFASAQVPGYSFNYQDPNDPTGTTYDVRWAVITTVSPASGMATSKRFILGATKRGGNGFYVPVALDTQVEK